MAGKGTRGVVLVGVAATLAAVALYVATRAEAAPIYTCPYCGAEFATQEELNQHILTAHPQVPPAYHLSIYKVGNGTVTPGSEDYSAGTTVTLTAVPDTGAVFDHWEGAAIGTSPTVNILMDQNKEVTAYFALIPTTATIYGVVTNEAGVPVSGATVYLGRSGETPFTSVTTDALGRYSINFEVSGGYLHTQAQKDGYYASAWFSFIPIAGESLQVNLVLKPWGAVTLGGKVADSGTGLPIPDVAVVIGETTVYTDTNGDYLFTGLDPLGYNVSFQKKYYTTVRQTIYLKEGENILNASLTSTAAAYMQFTIEIVGFTPSPIYGIAWRCYGWVGQSYLMVKDYHPTYPYATSPIYSFEVLNEHNVGRIFAWDEAGIAHWSQEITVHDGDYIRFNPLTEAE